MWGFLGTVDHKRIGVRTGSSAEPRVFSFSMVESTFSAIVLGAGALLSAGGAAYYLWRGFIHGIRRRRIMVRQVTFTGLPAFRWGLISVGYGVLFLAVALIGARDVFLWLIGS